MLFLESAFAQVILTALLLAFAHMIDSSIAMWISVPFIALYLFAVWSFTMCTVVYSEQWFAKEKVEWLGGILARTFTTLTLCFFWLSAIAFCYVAFVKLA